jgi:hypothetical protein
MSSESNAHLPLEELLGVAVGTAAINEDPPSAGDENVREDLFPVFAELRLTSSNQVHRFGGRDSSSALSGTPSSDQAVNLHPVDQRCRNANDCLVQPSLRRGLRVVFGLPDQELPKEEAARSRPDEGRGFPVAPDLGRQFRFQRLDWGLPMQSIREQVGALCGTHDVVDGHRFALFPEDLFSDNEELASGSAHHWGGIVLRGGGPAPSQVDTHICGDSWPSIESGTEGGTRTPMALRPLVLRSWSRRPMTAECLPARLLLWLV